MLGTNNTSQQSECHAKLGWFVVVGHQMIAVVVVAVDAVAVEIDDYDVHRTLLQVTVLQQQP